MRLAGGPLIFVVRRYVRLLSILAFLGSFWLLRESCRTGAALLLLGFHPAAAALLTHAQVGAGAPAAAGSSTQNTSPPAASRVATNSRSARPGARPAGQP